MWTGNICYIGGNDFVEYCCVDANENEVCDEGEEVLCTDHDYCCLDADADGNYEHCDPLTDFGDVCPGSEAEDLVDLCCVDTDLEVLGYEYCDLLGEVVDPQTDDCPLVYDYFGEELDYERVDDVAYASVTAWCKTIDPSVWVFNIADFVGLLWDIEGPSNSGASVIKVRFYPLPLNTK